MKNIKVCFHHPNFIYNFKINLVVYAQQNSLLTLDFSQINQKFMQIRQKQLIVTSEQAKMLDSLSIVFKKQFLKKYQQVLQSRMQLQNIHDYLGNTISQHYKYFQLTKQAHPLKHIKQLYIYFNRLDQLPPDMQTDIVTYFGNTRFISTLTQILNMSQHIDWEKGQAYTFYYCIIHVMYILLMRQGQILAECAQFAMKCLKYASRWIKYSMLTEISEICFIIWNKQLQAQQSTQWVHRAPQHSTQSPLLSFLLSILHQKQNKNIIIINSTVKFLQDIRLQCQTMNQLLMFITSSINQRIITIMDQLYNNYSLGVYQVRDSLLIGFCDDISDNYGRKAIRHREKEYAENKWNKIYKNGYKIITGIKHKFQEFKSGKIFQQKTRKLSMKEEHIRAKQEVQMMQNSEKYQQAYTRNEISPDFNAFNLINEIRIQNQEELKKVINDNQQLVRINKWYEELVNQKTKIIMELRDAVAELVRIKDNGANNKVRLESNLYEIMIVPTPRKSWEKEKVNRNLGIESDKNIRESNQQYNYNGNNAILPPLPPPPENYRTSQKSNSRRKSISNSQNRMNLLPPPPPITMPPQFTLPPPPPLPSGLNLFRSTNQQKGDHKEIKTINWTPIQISKIKDSFWEEVQQVPIDEQQIEQFFSKAPQKPVAIMQAKQQKKSILPGPRAKNIEIVLKKIKISPLIIPNAIQNLDDTVLTANTVESLLNILPTDKQFEQFSEVSIEVDKLEKWSIADQYFLTIVKIPNYEETLKAIRFKGDFQGIVKVYKKNVTEFIQFFTGLQQDKFLKQFFTEMLSIGNYMNQNNTKGNAYGFRFQSIQKTFSVSGSDNKLTLFQYIIKSMHKRGIKFPDNKYYKSCFIVPMEVLRDDLKQLRKMCENVQQCLLRGDEEDERIPQYFLGFYIEVREQIASLDQRFNHAYKVFKFVADFYCQKMETEKIVKIYNSFKAKLKKVLDINLPKWKHS